MESNGNKPRNISGKIVTAYAVLSGLWIFFSDSLLDLMVDDPRLITRLGMYKGWFFVLVTSTLLYVLIRRYVRQLADYHDNLLEAERRFREMMEQVHMIAIMLDERGRILFCNDFLLRLTGWSRDEVLSRDWFELFVSASDRDRLQAFFEQGVMNGSFPTHYENAIVTRSGAERLIVWDNTILRNPAGEMTGVASLGMDVTDHRAMEMHVRQSQKMESIGTLAGGVAHDFNNILTVIMSCANMLRSRRDDRERAELLIGQIEGAAQRASHLTGSLLTFSRKQPIAPRLMELNELVERMGGFLERIIGEDVLLSIEPSRRRLQVLADGGQIEQVIMNLAVNARDAMPGGGGLTIRTDMARMDSVLIDDGTEVTGDFARISVCDTGSGIEPEHLKRIFEPFYTTKELGKGTGLGLSMAYGIIKQHNGWISVESELGKGSCFSIYLPLSETP